MATIKCEYHGVEGEGKTLTAARADAIKKLGRCHKAPLILSHRGVTLVAWQTPYGVSCTVVDPDAAGRLAGSSMECGDLDTCRPDLVRRLLDRAREEGDYAVPAWADSMIGEYKRRRMLADWQYHDEFQRRYRDAEARGMNAHDAHDYAARNPARPELWAEALAS